MNWIKSLPITKGRLAILFEIYSEDETYLRNIAKQLQINPSLVHGMLKNLEKAGLIRGERKGKEIYYSLNKNRDYRILAQLLEEYHLEKVMQKTKIIETMLTLLLNNKDLIKTSSHIYLFGSSVHRVTKESDIDLLFIHKDKKIVGRICREISMILGKTVNPVIYTEKQFKRDLADKEPFLTSITQAVKNRAMIK